MAYCLQPHIDFYSRFEVNNVLLHLSFASMIYHCQYVETPNIAPI